ncbi:M16 family metallopeptidase [Streptomyces syringium]|uniref:M16 family metallopeptidase n=1 Tax=Streptomyces syringium TaxID=76729 RepID=UPI00340E76FA
MTAPAVIRMPQLSTHTCSNGLTITASALPTVPLVQGHLAVRLPLHDRQDLAVYDVLAACWPDLPACARFEQLGGQVSINRRQQWIVLSLVGTADLMPAIAVTLRAAVDAQYTEDQVRAAVTKAAQQASLVTAHPAVYSARRLWEQFYGYLPPVADPSPHPDDIATVSAAQVTEAGARCLLPSQSHVVVVGATDPDQVVAHFEQALASWTGTCHSAPQATPSLSPAPQRRIVTHVREGWQQTHLRLAAPSRPRHDHALFAAAQAASLILGGSFSSRINTALRERHGLAYRTLASINDHLDSDVLIVEADVNAVSAAEAMTELTRQMTEFATSGPTGHELDEAIGFITGKYALSLDSQGGIATCVLSYLTLGLPLSGIADIPARVAALTLTDVREAAALFHPEHMSGVVCGDATHLPTEWS